MKITFTLILLLSLNFTIKSQTVDIIKGLNEPTTIAKVGNTMYFGEFNGNLRKFDITNIDAGTSQITDTNGVYRSTLKGNELFYTEIYSGKVSKINITEEDPDPLDFITDSPFPVGITSDDKYIYYSERTTDEMTSIMKVQADNPDSISVLYSTLDDPTAICKMDDYIYFIEGFSSNIFRFDVNTQPVDIELMASGFIFPTDLICSEDKLYVSDFDGNSVFEIVITANESITKKIVKDLDGPTGLFLDNNDLYIGVFFENKIVKYSFPTTSVKQFNTNTLSIYPNPTSDFIKLSGVESEGRYEIFDLSGKLIQSGSTNFRKEIDLRQLKTGSYFLRSENGISSKFTKI